MLQNVMHIYCKFLIFTVLLNIVNSELCPFGTLIIKRGLAPEEEQAVTDEHNKWRQKIVNEGANGNPKAKFLPIMTYDTLLSMKSHMVSKQCVPIPMYINDRRWDYLAQMNYLSCSSEFKPFANWTEAVEAWFNESANFQYPNGKKSEGDVSHFRQLAFDQTDTFGCDYVIFFNQDLNCEEQVCTLFTCLYGNDANSPNNLNLAPYQLADTN